MPRKSDPLFTLSPRKISALGQQLTSSAPFVSTLFEFMHSGEVDHMFNIRLNPLPSAMWEYNATLLLLVLEMQTPQ